VNCCVGMCQRESDADRHIGNWVKGAAPHSRDSLLKFVWPQLFHDLQTPILLYPIGVL